MIILIARSLMCLRVKHPQEQLKAMWTLLCSSTVSNPPDHGSVCRNASRDRLLRLFSAFQHKNLWCQKSWSHLKPSRAKGNFLEKQHLLVPGWRDLCCTKPNQPILCVSTSRKQIPASLTLHQFFQPLLAVLSESFLTNQTLPSYSSVRYIGEAEMVFSIQAQRQFQRKWQYAEKFPLSNLGVQFIYKIGRFQSRGPSGRNGLWPGGLQEFAFMWTDCTWRHSCSGNESWLLFPSLQHGIEDQDSFYACTQYSPEVTDLDSKF